MPPKRSTYSVLSTSIVIYSYSVIRVTGATFRRFKIKHEGPEDYENMWQKSRAIWKYINFHYRDDFDWFVLGGDDVFLIVENLRQV